VDIQPIRTDKDHRAALAAIEASWGAVEGTEKGDKLDVLLALVDIYEAKRWPIETNETFDPIDVRSVRRGRFQPTFLSVPTR
jgi:HTH-type transcriptional regulator/antitoxin HigA